MWIGTSGKSPKFGIDDIKCWKSEIKRKKYAYTYTLLSNTFNWN